MIQIYQNICIHESNIRSAFNESNPQWYLLDSAREPRVYIQPEDPGSRPLVSLSITN